MNRIRPSRGRRTARTGAFLAVLAAAAAGYAPPAAYAGITTFTVSPGSGPPGTVVHVTGAGCKPGLLGSAQTDFVTVTAPTLHVVLRIPVSANGSWSGSFAAPADGLGASAAVAAACVAGGLQSLTTIYTPQTFTVTTAPQTTPGTSTTTPGTGGTTPGAPPTTGTPDPAHPGTVFVPDYPSVVVGVPSDVPPASNDSGGGTGDATPGDATPGAHGGARGAIVWGGSGDATKRSATAGPASLQQADLGSYVGSDDAGGLGWLGGLLLLALVIAACGATVLIWRARRAREAATEQESA